MNEAIYRTLETPLLAAVSGEKIVAVKVLLRSGANLMSRQMPQNDNILHVACKVTP